MLNTDLFNVSIKKDKKMTKQQWQSHVRGVNDGKDLPLDFVNDIYDRIRNNEIKMESETNMFARAGKKGFCMKQGGKIRTWKKRFFILSGEEETEKKKKVCSCFDSFFPSQIINCFTLSKQLTSRLLVSFLWRI